MGVFLKNKNAVINGEQDKHPKICMREGQKSPSIGSLGKPCDAKRRSVGRNFLAHPYTHGDRFV